jgi:molybdopterin/thiamine biosynthesis adenylyltransferase/rhodanese-related sulfurtransferase
MSAERYDRQLILKGFGEEAQQKLAAATVLVIGAGGLGCPALQYLVASGVGHIGIIDGDTVSLSNLHRQVLFSTADIGKLKVEVAAARLTKLNPEIRIEIHPANISGHNILPILKNYEYIIDGTDNFESRYLISDACALLKKPLIFAAVSGFEGQLAIFNVKDQQGQTTNYRDIFPVPPAKGEIPNCAENGVLGVLPGIIGTMQAAETIKLITGIGTPLINKILNYNLLNQQFYEISISPSPVGTYTLPLTENDFLKLNTETSKDQKINQVLEIDIKELEELQKQESVIIIDVREKDEMPQLNTTLYIKAPMSDFENLLKKDLAEEHIVLLCQHGIRSLAAAEFLHEKYASTKQIYSLKGGIVRWKNFFTTAS